MQAEKDIAIEICPSSNVHTGAIRSLSEHPARQFVSSGTRAHPGTARTLLRLPACLRACVPARALAAEDPRDGRGEFTAVLFVPKVAVECFGYTGHPAVTGVRCCPSCDNSLLSSTTTAAEYAKLGRECGFGPAELASMAADAHGARFTKIER